MGIRYLFLLTVFCFHAASADFSNTSSSFHPLMPADGPFIIEIKGDWSTDCHPGEQKPVIREYTGDSVLIEFDIITEHVTCNEVATAFRVLVDMSDVVGSVTEPFLEIEVTVRFDGFEYVRTHLLACPMCSPVPVGPFIQPEAGLYFNEALDKQGLILARQNHRMGVYPLIYDESGSSEWLFGGNGIVEDVFFTILIELTGGQCLGCPPPDQPTEMNTVGKLSMLMDSEGLIQVKINDGLFIPYQPIVFGYGEQLVYAPPVFDPVSIPDLSGRWAFSKSSSNQPGSIAPASILPLVFDVALKGVSASKGRINPPQLTLTPAPPSEVIFSVLDMGGEQVADMRCRYEDEVICNLRVPEPDGVDRRFEVKLLSVERMIVTYVGDPQAGLGAGTGTAVRID